MKTKSIFLATASGLAVFAGLAIAATTAVTPSASAVPAAPAPAAPGAEIRARLADKLGLTPEQRQAVEELRAKQHAELMALLTPEQQKQAEELRADMGERLHRFAGSRGRGEGFGRGPGGLRGPGGRSERRGPGGPGMAPHGPQDPLATIAQADRIKDRLAEQLQLTDAQQDQLEHLGRGFRAAQRDAMKKHLEEMRAVLTPEQQQKWEQLKQRFARGPGGGRPPRFGMNPGPDVDRDGEFAGLPPPPPDES